MAYEICFENKGVVVNFEGSITINEINEANGKLHGHKNFDSHKYHIINLLGVDLSSITEKEALIPAAMDWVASQTRSNIKVAILAEGIHEESLYLAYILQSRKMGTSWEFELFSNIKDAREWIAN